MLEPFEKLLVCESPYVKIIWTAILSRSRRGVAFSAGDAAWATAQSETIESMEAKALRGRKRSMREKGVAPFYREPAPSRMGQPDISHLARSIRHEHATDLCAGRGTSIRSVNGG